MSAFLLSLSLLNGCQGALILLIHFRDLEEGKHVSLFDAVSFINFDPLHVSGDLRVKRCLVESLYRRRERYRKDRRFLHGLYDGHKRQLLDNRRSYTSAGLRIVRMAPCPEPEPSEQASEGYDRNQVLRSRNRTEIFRHNHPL